MYSESRALTAANGPDKTDNFQSCRHQDIALDMLIKLVRVFGSVIYSSLSAPASVGINIEAEQRSGSFFLISYLLLIIAIIVLLILLIIEFC